MPIRPIEIEPRFPRYFFGGGGAAGADGGLGEGTPPPGVGVVELGGFGATMPRLLGMDCVAIYFPSYMLKTAKSVSKDAPAMKLRSETQLAKSVILAQSFLSFEQSFFWAWASSIMSIPLLRLFWLS